MCNAEILQIHPCDSEHQVVSFKHSTATGHTKQPCPQCPWRKDATGVFPAEAFRHSAVTAHDASMHSFACHSAGTKTPKTCAGFLLQNSDNNISVRLGLMRGVIDMSSVHDGGHELHASYKDMAIANGVAPDDPALAQCRSNAIASHA